MKELQGWPVEAVPRGFATRVLEEADRRRQLQRVALRKRGLLALSLAALVCGSAFAATSLPQSESARKLQPMGKDTVGRLLETPSGPKSSLPNAVKVGSSPKKPARKPTAPEKEEPPSKPRPVPLPSCDCGPGAIVCTCRE